MCQFATPPLVFAKMKGRGLGPVFFLNFNIIISHIFPENVIKIPQVALKI